MYAKAARRILLGGTAAFAAIGVAQGQSTPAGTTVMNQAQATYSVNGTSATVQSNISTFVVDRKVDFTVVAQTGNTQVNLGQAGAVLTFTVTNHTNAAQDFLLEPDQQSLSLGILPGSDNFDMTNLRVYVDKNGNGIYEPGVDDQTYIDELGAEAAKVVFIVADTPNSAAAQLAFMSLHVTAAEGGVSSTQGAALNATLTPNQDNVVDIVFADGDSDGAFLGDISRNGQARVYAAYEVGVRAVDLTIAKSSRVISDGVDILNPRALPGATVEYCLLVNNATLTTPATNVVLTDTMPDHTTYVAGSIKVGGTCLLGGEAQDDDANDSSDGTTYSASFDTGAKRVTATIPTVTGGGQLAAVFRVTIN